MVLAANAFFGGDAGLKAWEEGGRLSNGKGFRVLPLARCRIQPLHMEGKTLGSATVQTHVFYSLDDTGENDRFSPLGDHTRGTVTGINRHVNRVWHGIHLPSAPATHAQPPYDCLVACPNALME